MPRKKAPQATQKTAGPDDAQDFEGLGVFYLGRPYDLSSKDDGKR